MSIYVPILKGKEGEFAALDELDLEIKALIAPLIQVSAVPWDYESGKPAKTIEAHIKSLPRRLFRSVQRAQFYLETPFFADSRGSVNDPCALKFLLDECLLNSMTAIPVLTSSSSRACIEAVRTYGREKRQVCIRLSLSDFAEEVDTAEIVGGILNGIERQANSGVDLIVDFGDLKNDNSTSLLLARSVLSMIPKISDWRKLIFASASFPEDLSEVTSRTTTLLPRKEWLLWQSLHRKASTLPRELVFSDYAISHPITKGLDPRIMRMSANIRYTTPEAWLVVKGRNVNQYGFEQYFELCKQLIDHEEYSGKEFSWGDEFIWRCAHHDAGPGNATTWRKVGVNHHMELVTGLLSKAV